MLPISAAVPKALLPLVDSTGLVRCVLHVILREALSAGVVEAAVVTSPGQRAQVQRYLAAAEGCGEALPAVEFIEQAESKGLGDAVLRAADFAAGEPLVVMLGDHVHIAAAGERSCCGQLVAAFEGQGGVAMIGMQVVDASKLSLMGVGRGEPVAGEEHLYRCVNVVEKPDEAKAAAELVTPGVGGGRYLAHNGHYIFTAEIFDCLAEVGCGAGGEIGLTDAQRLLLQRWGQDYYLLEVAGRVCDVGSAEGYSAALAAFGARPQSCKGQ